MQSDPGKDHWSKMLTNSQHGLSADDLSADDFNAVDMRVATVSELGVWQSKQLQNKVLWLQFRK